MGGPMTSAVTVTSKAGLLGLVVAALGVAGCEPGSTGPQPGPRLLADQLTPIDSPAGPGSGEPFLHTAPDGTVLMSWLEAGDTAHSLRFARLSGTTWDEPRTIVSSSIFFVNWADFPSIIQLSDGRLMSHWLKRSGPGTYSYDVWVAFSADGGATWSDPVRPHDDATATEHGFVTLFEHEGRPAATWLDGRQYADGDDGPATEEMSVRFTTFDSDGSPDTPGTLVDGRTCDCCQTAVATAAAGPVLVYRDRSAEEIRDIVVSRLTDGAWTEPVPVHDDGWHINACPVNGPAIDADGDNVAVAWFTAAQDTARVRVAFSSDSGQRFTDPIRVDLGAPTGRVDLILLDPRHALVSWLERSGGTAQVMARTISVDGELGQPLSIGGSSADRASGFPRMTRAGDRVIVAWTLPGQPSRIQIAAVPIADS